MKCSQGEERVENNYVKRPKPSSSATWRSVVLLTLIFSALERSDAGFLEGLPESPLLVHPCAHGLAIVATTNHHHEWLPHGAERVDVHPLSTSHTKVAKLCGC